MIEERDTEQGQDQSSEEAPEGGPETAPRGNPEPDREDVERAEDKLDQISGN